jgi:hypothetical protein
MYAALVDDLKTNDTTQAAVNQPEQRRTDEAGLKRAVAASSSLRHSRGGQRNTTVRTFHQTTWWPELS